MQLKASQDAHKVTANRIQEIEGQYQGLLDQEKQKAERSIQKSQRIEADKERLAK